MLSLALAEAVRTRTSPPRSSDSQFATWSVLSKDIFRISSGSGLAPPRRGGMKILSRSPRPSSALPPRDFASGQLAVGRGGDGVPHARDPVKGHTVSRQKRAMMGMTYRPDILQSLVLLHSGRAAVPTCIVRVDEFRNTTISHLQQVCGLSSLRLDFFNPIFNAHHHFNEIRSFALLGTRLLYRREFPSSHSAPLSAGAAGAAAMTRTIWKGQHLRLLAAWWFMAAQCDAFSPPTMLSSKTRCIRSEGRAWSGSGGRGDAASISMQDSKDGAARNLSAGKGKGGITRRDAVLGFGLSFVPAVSSCEQLKQQK